MQSGLNVSAELARILYGRGIKSVEAGRDFLQPNQSQMHDPFLFCDMADGVSTIRNTIANKGSICIYGDYDADGTAASAILYLALKEMGARVECFLPSRLEHGYGLSMEAVEKLKGFQLLITVDCGITNIAEIEKVKAYGIRTIITDHHECGRILPPADYILNPKRAGETYPYADLCGAGVAFKLAQALIGELAFRYIDIAAVATVADIVPLNGENRVIAALGLEKLNSDPNKGIRALYVKAGLRRERIDAQTVSFGLAPRINAAGRIATARTAFDLMVEEDEKKLEQLAEQLCALNADRQGRQECVVKQAMEMKVDPDDRLILLYRESWDVGIVGLAASKIAEYYNRPTILLGKANGFYTGSARSIDGVNIYEALKTQADLYEKFGGHAGAAGLTVKEEHLGRLKSRLNLYLKEAYAEEVFRPVRYYDLKTQVAHITPELIGELERLKPYGHKNGPVELLIHAADITGIRPIGEDRHAKFVLRHGKHTLNAVCFGMRACDVPAHADVVGTAAMNSFDHRPQMVVGTLSFRETHAFALERAMEYIKNTRAPEQKERYFCNREGLLRAYTVLKGIDDHKLSFADMDGLIAFIKRHVEEMTDERIAFVFCVLEEIELLTIQKNAKIHVVIDSGKRNLLDSQLYHKFRLEEMQDGFERKNQEH